MLYFVCLLLYHFKDLIWCCVYMGECDTQAAVGGQPEVLRLSSRCFYLLYLPGALLNHSNLPASGFPGLGLQV